MPALENRVEARARPVPCSATPALQAPTIRIAASLLTSWWKTMKQRKRNAIKRNESLDPPGREMKRDGSRKSEWPLASRNGFIDPVFILQETVGTANRRRG